MLHSQTLTFLAILLQLLLPLVVLWTTAGQSRKTVWCWCAGALLGGVGMALIAGRPVVPDWATHHLANTLLLICWMMTAQALRLLLGRPWTSLQLALWLFAAWGVYSLIYSLLEPSGRALAMRALLAALMFHAVWLSVQAARRYRSHNGYVLALNWLALGLVLLAQMVLYRSGGLSAYPLNATWDAGVLALMLLVTSTVAHVAFAGLVAELAAHDLAQAEQAQAGREEAARLQASLQQSERHSRLVLVSGTLAHELNQPLTVAHTHIQLAQRLLKKGQVQSPLLPELLSDAEVALERSDRILERTREAARAQPMPLQRLDLGVLLQDVISQFSDDWQGLGVQWTQQLPEGPLWCQGHPVALSQLLVNLFRNATQVLAGSPRRQLRLTVQTLTVDTPQGPLQQLLVRLHDSGPGLPAEVLARWGDPFVSTRSDGLGLGLAISRAIAEQHGGQLLLRNHPDGGAVAELLLPLPRLEGAAC
jgi:signal transduction histidine kinase